MSFFSGASNIKFFNNCQSLQGLTVTLEVTEDLVTLADSGFSLQLNCYPQPAQIPQGEDLPVSDVGDLSLTWFQYIIIITDSFQYEIQYWSTNTHSYDASADETWPPGYSPDPPGTTPWLPVFPHTALFGEFGSGSPGRLNAGSKLEISLSTDAATANITAADFSVTDPDGNTAKAPTQSFSTTPPEQFAIYGFQLDLSSAPGLPTWFSSGAGVITYSVSESSLSIQSSGPTCSATQPGTAENSNAVYGEPTPMSGSTITQSFRVAPLALSFALDKSTYGQDEVTSAQTWPSAYWLAISGFSNSQMGFSSPAKLSSQPNPIPTVFASINSALNPGLSATQLATITANLPAVNTFGPSPVLATDATLVTNYQTFLYPYTISFPNQNAFNALQAHEVAVITLTATFTVPVPTGTSNGSDVTTPVTLTAAANIELAKGEDPYLLSLNPAAPQSYPSWLSFDLRIFTTTSTQPHQLFSVSNPTGADDAVRYIREVLQHLNNPGLITNGDTFDNALTQSEEGSALMYLPTDDAGVPAFNFAVARVRLRSTINTTINPVRVFFRLFNAASTVTDFHEVGTAEGTYRWGTNGSPGHKIPLLGVQGGVFGFGAEYVTVPVFATERVNAASPADMKTQTDPPNAVAITTVAGSEVDTHFGAWLDLNQTNRFLIPEPPPTQSLWDGPWTGTETLSAVIAAAPHQCLIAEIRFDDTPIPTAATTSTSDKLAQRNIAWLGVQP